MKYWASSDEMYPVWYLEEMKDNDPAWKGKYDTPIELNDAEKAMVDVAWDAWEVAQKMISEKGIAYNEEYK